MADDKDVRASDDADLTRRDLLKLGAAATVAASLNVPQAVAQTTQTFFTTDELQMVDELSEMIIPADQQSPGARAAKVAAYIDARLAEAWENQERLAWRKGLSDVDKLSKTLAGKTFLASSPAERLAVLTRMAQNEKAPKLPEERFFATLKSRVVHAYYTSEIGIRQEMEYKGNSYLAEFVGFDVS